MSRRPARTTRLTRSVPHIRPDRPAPAEWADLVSGTDPRRPLWVGEQINPAAIPAALARGEDLSGWVWCLAGVALAVAGVLAAGLYLTPWAALALVALIGAGLAGVAVRATRHLHALTPSLPETGDLP